jgi:Uma2 family endonuclease
MASIESPPDCIATLADLLARLGGITPDRIRFHPPPGTATEKDVVEIERRENRLCELIDGVLVEKIMGFRESLLAVAMATFLKNFVAPRNLGLVSGADGMTRLFPGLVRIPDVAFTSWARVPGGIVPKDPVPDLVPDLAVEVISEGNTKTEMERKSAEYFASGVRLLWLIDPGTRTATASTGEKTSVTLTEDQTLDGGEVLPGFQLPLRDLFAELDRAAGP